MCKNQKAIALRVRKLLNFILKFDSSFVETIQKLKYNQLKSHLHQFLNNYIQGNENLIKVFF